jgi:hypothetical protein
MSVTVSRLATILGIFYDDLLHSLDIADPITESNNDLDALAVQDSIPSIAETFHVVPETFIVLLLDGLQGLCCRRMLVCVLEVPNKYGA